MSRSSDSDKRALWRERFQEFTRSGLTVERFCARQRVSVTSFYNWRRRIGGPSSRRRKTRPGREAFRRVDVVGTTSEVGVAGAASEMNPFGAITGVSIQLPCGTHIEVCVGHLDTVRAVVGEVVRAGRGLENGASPSGLGLDNGAFSC
ncbi:MAG: hypothetical protein ACE5EC_00335 [Phycisphaerae bacterium]